MYTDLVSKFADTCEFYGSGAWQKAESVVEQGLEEFDLKTLMEHDPSVIRDVLTDDDLRDRLAEEIERVVTSSISPAEQRGEISAIVRGYLWHRAKPELIYAVRCELERREQEREAETETRSHAELAADDAGVSLTGEL